MVLVCTRTFHYIVLLQVAATSCFTPDRVHRIDSTYCYTDIVVWVSVCLYVSVMGTTMSSAKQLIQSRCRLGGAVPCAPRNQMEIHIGAAGRIRLNNSCAAAMRRYLKLLWPFVLRRTIAIGHFRHFFLCGVPQYSAPRLSRMATGGLVEAHFDMMAGDKFHVSHAAERRI